MRKFLLAVLLALTPMLARAQSTVVAEIPDRTVSSATFDSLSDSIVISMSGRLGAGFQIVTSDLECELNAFASMNGASGPWQEIGIFSASDLLSDTNPFTISSGDLQAFIAVPGGASHVKIEVTGYTSGTGTATLRATIRSGYYLPSTGVTIGNVVAVDASPTAALPLPNNAAQETGGNLDDLVTNTTAIAAALAGTLSVNLGLTDAELRAAPVPVSGTIAATQSGTWTVQPGNTANTTAWLVTGTGGMFPVTGTFWQATQPVSGTFWQATQPVSGTFWQATQPVSGPLTDAQLRAAVVHVDGQVAEDAASASNPMQVGGQARKDRKTAMSAEDDSVRAAYDMYGRANVLGIKWTPTYLQVTSSGATTIVAAGGSGVRTRVFRVECSNSSLTTPLSVGLKSPSMFSGAVFGLKYIPQAGGLAVWMLGNSYLETGNNEAFQINLSVAGTVDCTTYTESVVN